jgi:hypothetical protein
LTSFCFGLFPFWPPFCFDTLSFWPLSGLTDNVHKTEYAKFLLASFYKAPFLSASFFWFDLKRIMLLFFKPLFASDPYRFLSPCGLMENADYAGFLYASFPTPVCFLEAL